MKIIIESITEWEKDNAKIEGDLSHGTSESNMFTELAGETKAKKESEWTKGLPFVWEGDVELDVNGAVDLGHDVWTYLDAALAEYAAKYCANDYLRPVRFEGRIVA